ncbi:hypothetical protein JG688_00014058 [Phytophthora aleatoria]|uniref:Uncharacterized protein n=1 Tax=Phytophthora aleatoria TaxID=2496075 RepID=A0A8J5ME60_9STRA|nr:hypothetical protein JG688_00014058 [Phytophthora aleatoria]
MGVSWEAHTKPKLTEVLQTCKETSNVPSKRASSNRSQEHVSQEHIRGDSLPALPCCAFPVQNQLWSPLDKRATPNDERTKTRHSIASFRCGDRALRTESVRRAVERVRRSNFKVILSRYRRMRLRPPSSNPECMQCPVMHGYCCICRYYYNRAACGWKLADFAEPSTHRPDRATKSILSGWWKSMRDAWSLQPR